MAIAVAQVRRIRDPWSTNDARRFFQGPDRGFEDYVNDLRAERRLARRLARLDPAGVFRASLGDELKQLEAKLPQVMKAMDDGDIRLPDPDIFERPFLAIPLFELAPDLVLDGARVGAIAAAMAPDGLKPLRDYSTLLNAEVRRCRG